MKILEKDFNKLKQLDRIEYLLRKRKIEEFNNNSYCLIFLKCLIFVMVVGMLLIPQGYLVWGIEFVEDISNVCGFFIGFLIILSAFGFSADMVFSLVRDKDLTDLHEKYFKMEVKK